ncbi:MAG: hypothetical protein ACE5Q6_07650 [Dehalococcoidia bacterium]
MVTQPTEQFFPPFGGGPSERALNLLVNGNPVTFSIRAFFLTQPELARMLGPTADALIRSQGLPGNLYRSDRTPRYPLQPGDRVRSPRRVWPQSRLFGGYILSISDGWAVVQWDFFPIGPLTYDPLSWLEPQNV